MLRNFLCLYYRNRITMKRQFEIYRMWLAMRGNFTLLTDETVNVIIVNLNKKT